MMNPTQSAFPVDPAKPAQSHAGLTQRDFAALMAMQGLASNPQTRIHDLPELAETAYKVADAMIARANRLPAD